MSKITIKERYKDGQFIIKEGTYGESTYVILLGEVKILKKINNEQVVVAILRKDDIFGEMSFIDRRPRSASALAVGDVEIGLIDKDFLEGEINKTSGQFRTILQAITERLRETTSQLVSLTAEYYKLKGIKKS